MNMNNVKAITLPNNTKVKKIEDSSGNIIWVDDTKYLYRQLEWIKFTGDQYCSINDTWDNTHNKAYGINAIRDATDANIEGILAGNGGDSYNNGGYICRINSNSQGYYFNYKAGGSTSGNYILNDYFPNNSERTFWTYMQSNIIVLDVRNAQGTVLGNDEFARSSGTWPGNSAILIGASQPYSSGSIWGKLKGVKIKSFVIADATVSTGSVINIGTITTSIIPCQRKSDSKLGFYNINTKEFYPLTGTTTSANIGPTVDEYPDSMSTNF